MCAALSWSATKRAAAFSSSVPHARPRISGAASLAMLAFTQLAHTLGSPRASVGVAGVAATASAAAMESSRFTGSLGPWAGRDSRRADQGFSLTSAEAKTLVLLGPGGLR